MQEREGHHGGLGNGREATGAIEERERFIDATLAAAKGMFGFIDTDCR